MTDALNRALTERDRDAKERRREIERERERERERALLALQVRSPCTANLKKSSQSKDQLLALA